MLIGSISLLVRCKISATKIGVLLGYGNGTFSEPILSFVDDLVMHMQNIVTDLNNDQISDIVVINTGLGYIYILYGNGDGTFVVKTNILLEENFELRKISVADVNGDDYKDIVVTSTNLDGFVVCYGNVDGSFIEITTSNIQTSYIPFSINVNDFNNDNFMDIAFVNSDSNTIDVFLGYGNGSFETKKTSPTGGVLASQYMIVGDFNEDEILDLIVMQPLVSSLNVIFGYGNGSFGDKIKLILLSNLGSLDINLVTLVDFNRDNHLDVVVCQGNPCVMFIFYGDGNGSFERDIIFPTKRFNNYRSISTGDLDGDGYSDIITSFNYTLEILFNTGQCT